MILRIIITLIPLLKKKDIFGVPLNESLQIANTSIAYADKNVHTVIGSIPIVVAKCGAFLKDQGNRRERDGEKLFIIY